MGRINTFYSAILGRKAQPTDIRESAAPVQKIEHVYTAGHIQESATGMISMAIENHGWAPIGGWNNTDGISLTDLRVEADTCRAVAAINPLIKKAVLARTGMIHGKGSTFTAKPGSSQAKIDSILDTNDRVLFGSAARARLEADLSAVGNVWIIRDKKHKALQVPVEHIAGYITADDDVSKVLYWKRAYSTRRLNISTGTEEPVNVTEYIPAHDNEHPVSQIGQDPVRRDIVMVHVAANRQTGWVLGLPDIFAARFWTQGHKEMYEAGHEYALAQGQFAMQVTGGSGLGTQQAAARLAEEPRRDPETGQVYGYGGTFAASDGVGLQMLGKMGSGVDFKAYDRVVGLIAAATGVPLDVLLANSDSEDTSLEQSTVDDMKLRQRLWSELYEDFFGSVRVDVSWPRIKQDSLYRVNQSIEISNRTNTLHAPEKRMLALDAYGLDGDPNEVPDIMDHPDIQVYKAKKELDLEYAELIAQATAKGSGDTTEVTKNEDTTDKRSTTPDQGNDQGVGKLSDGADAHDARDAGEQEHTG